MCPEPLLRIDPRYALLIDAAAQVAYLIDEVQPVVLFGEPVVHVLGCIDGLSQAPRVAERAAGRMDHDLAVSIIAALVEDGIVVADHTDTSHESPSNL